MSKKTNNNDDKHGRIKLSGLIKEFQHIPTPPTSIKDVDINELKIFVNNLIQNNDPTENIDGDEFFGYVPNDK